jgi:hypothetical protein
VESALQLLVGGLAGQGAPPRDLETGDRHG